MGNLIGSSIRSLLLSAVALASGAAVAEVPMETTFAPSVEFFSAFNDYEVGTHLYDSTSPTGWKDCGVFANKVKAAYYAKANCKGSGGLYVTNDAPGKYIYSSLTATRPMAVNPCGIRHDYNGSANATFIYLNNMGTPLGTNAAHTVEMFYKVDRAHDGLSPIIFYYDPYSGDNKQRAIVWLLKGNNSLRLQNLGSEAPVSASGLKYEDYVYGDITTLVNDGHWHHVAVVYKSEWEGVKLYCDYQLVSDVIKVNIGVNTSQMRIGDNSNGFPGLISACRVSTVALEPSGFLRASNNSNGPSANTENYLYPFNEETVGTHCLSAVTKFKGYNAFGDVAVNSYVVGEGYNEVCAESPGRYLYDGVYSKVPVAADVKSVRQHNPDLGSNANYGILRLVSGSHRMARYGTYTLEFFWKMETFHNSLDMIYWDMAKETTSPEFRRRFALAMGTSSSAEFLRLWTLTAGADAPASMKTEVPYAGYKTSSGRETGLADGMWHHTAIVYDGTAKTARLYCDYALVSETTVSLGDLTGMDLPNTSCELRYGSYKWASWLSAVRISKGKLTPDRFLYASDSPDGALPKAGVTWRLDGATGATVAESNATVTAKQYVHTIAAGAKGDVVVSGSAAYANDYAHGRRVVNGVRGTVNKSAATLSAGTSMRSSGLGPLVSSASAFTVQAMVKLASRPASGAASVLAQADTANGYAWALVTKADGTLAFKAKLVNVDGTTADWELASSATLPLADWHHVAVTCDKESGAVKLYLDQVEVASNASTAGQLLCGDGALVAGAVGPFGTVDGVLDEVIFNREILDPSDFQKIIWSGLAILFR